MFYVASKLGWMLIQPGNLATIAIALGFVLHVAGRARRVSVLCLGAGLSILLIAGATPLPHMAFAVLEDRFPRPPVDMPTPDGIVTLGGAIDPVLSAHRNTVALNTYAERLIATVELARRFPDARIVYAGGAGGLPVPEEKEADAARRLFSDLGLDQARVSYERTSRNTHENAVRTREVAQPQPGERWLLVTSAFHMPRAVGVFRAVGWEVTPYPVDYHVRAGGVREGWRVSVDDGLQLLGLALHEYVGLAAYWLTGRTDTLFPAPEKG